MAEIDYEKLDPFRTPDWRHQRVREMLGSVNPGLAGWNDDKYVRRYRSFMSRYSRIADDADRNRLAYEDPALYWAYQMVNDPANAVQVMHVKARILAGQTDQEIGAKLGTLPRVISWFSTLWFDIKDRLGAIDWITASVFEPETRRQRESAGRRKPKGSAKTEPMEPRLFEPFGDASLLFFGYYGGPVLLDVMLTGFAPGEHVDDAENCGDWLDKQFRTKMRLVGVATIGNFNVTNENAVQLFELHRSLMAERKSNGSAATKPDRYTKIIEAATREVKLFVGPAGPNKEILHKYDSAAAELRDDELSQVVSGKAKFDDMANLKLPDLKSQNQPPTQ